MRDSLVKLIGSRSAYVGILTFEIESGFQRGFQCHSNKSVARAPVQIGGDAMQLLLSSEMG
jgi:hypothetical protein